MSPRPILADPGFADSKSFGVTTRTAYPISTSEKGGRVVKQRDGGGMAAKCAAIAKSGSRCSRPALAGKQHCLMHDPDSTELRRQASVKGGYARSAKARALKQIPEAMTAEELAGWLSLVFKKVVAGSMEPKIGSAAAAIAKTIIDVQVVADQPAIAELEEQLRMIRSMVERKVA